MIEIKPGIHRLDGELSTTEKPLVVVHPFFEVLDGFYKPYVFKKDESFLEVQGINSQRYLANIISLFRSHRGQIIFLEEPDHIQSTAARIKSFTGRSRGIYFIPTLESSSEPFGISRKEFIGWIKSSSNEILLAGGYLRRTPEGEYHQCLGKARNHFENEDISTKFVKGCCFTWNI